MAKMTMALFSGSVDKLIGAGVILSGAAADDMDVEVFVLLMGARAFIKGKKTESVAELPEHKEEFLKALEDLNIPSWQDFFEQAKELTNVKIYICSLAGKIWGGEKMDDFIDLVDDICGIGEYVSSAQEADVHLFI